jgi:hypothetical protein
LGIGGYGVPLRLHSPVDATRKRTRKKAMKIPNISLEARFNS